MIDKSLRSKYAWGGPGGKSPGTSASGGSRNGGGGGPPGGGDRQMTYSAPAPSPDRQDRAREQAAAEQAAAERQEAERANQLAEARKLMTQPTTVDVPIKGPELIPGTTHPFTVDPYQQNYISPGKVRTTGIYNEGDYDKLVKAPVDVGFQEALRKQQIATDLRQKQQDPNYGQFFRPKPVVEKPKFFDTGLGNVVKNIGLGVVAPQLLAGTAFAKPYNLYRQYQTAKRFIPKDTRQTLINNLTTPKRTKTINTTSKDDRDDRREEGIMQAQTPQNIIEENIQKFSPEQLNLLRKRYAELQQVIESGEYNGQKLNNNQLATLTQTSKQMNDFLVSEVGGMRLT